MSTRTGISILNQNAPKHRWSLEQRDTLAVLQRFYQISGDERRDIFNRLYADTLRQEGFNNGLTTVAIASQLADMRHSPRGERFRDFIRLEDQQALRDSRLLRNKVEAVAASLHIELGPLPASPHSTVTPRITVDSDCDSEVETPTKRRKVTFERTETHSLSESSAGEPSDSETSCSGSSWIEITDESSLDGFEDDSISDEENRIGPKLKVRRDFNNKKVPARPRLLFRAFRPDHHLRARKFLSGSTSVSCPPVYNSTEFRDSAYRHLTADETFDSPWLSFTASLARALKIIMEAEHVLNLAIVEYNVIEAKLKYRHGNCDRIWLVPTLCRDFKVADKRFGSLRRVNGALSTSSHRRDYTGTDEFLIWGAIPGPPIAVFDKEAVCKLVSIMPRIKELRYDSGLFLGDFIDNIPYRYKQIFAYKLIRAFKVQGYHHGSRHWAFERFIQGVYKERCSRSISILSTQLTGSPDAEETDDPDWRGWSRATTPDISFRPRPQPRSITRRLVVEIPPLRESMAREYGRAVNRYSRIPEPANDEEDEEAQIQKMMDRQLAAESAEYGREYWR